MVVKPALDFDLNSLLNFTAVNTMPVIEEAQARKAATALLGYLEKQDSRNLMAEERRVHMQLQLHRVPAARKKGFRL